MNGRLTVLVPSRGRPANAWRLGEAFVRTGASSLPRFIIDDDDLLRHLYPAESIVTERKRLGPTLNWYCERWAEGDAFIGFMGDDHLPRTYGWAQTVVDTLSEPGVLACYGNDLLQGECLPTAIFVRSEAIQALGYFVPAGLVHLYIDNAWLALFGTIGAIRYLPDVVIEHMHPDAGKAVRDDRYLDVNSAEQNEADSTAYHAWYDSADFHRDVEALRALL